VELPPAQLSPGDYSLDVFGLIQAASAEPAAGNGFSVTPRLSMKPRRISEIRSACDTRISCVHHYGGRSLLRQTDWLKLYNSVNVPLVVILEIVPGAGLPANCAVPYKFPSVPKISSSGYSPSAPPVKVYRVFRVPFCVILKRVPLLLAPVPIRVEP
jgi:hypothetical protein